MGEHLSLWCCLLEMGTNFSEEESVFQLLTGLPQSFEWRMFKSQLEQWLHDAYSGTIITSALNSGGSISVTFQHNPMTFKSCLMCICGKASCQLNEKNLTGPGSEYAHMATTSTSVDTDPITGLWKHPKNPQGIFCTTPICSEAVMGIMITRTVSLLAEGWKVRHLGNRRRRRRRRTGPPCCQGHPLPLCPQRYPPHLFLLSLWLLLPLHSHHLGMPSLGIFCVYLSSLWTLEWCPPNLQPMFILPCSPSSTPGP
ncbi:hypothetical protein PAXRUDRAFT_151449 [Paxillus rubicundulus Ve08.2h10]|uniref:Uncharacterized protein n=1 Tax=Paxillus rubicundulus Ve08.2h10 TaxID=930991 RepID=A0A0D0DWT7_9AGAM|nr:hypothetical protein PAXRUDRAFT_151449 [Paxillus rubicundulus Ve08.2h10]